MTNLTGTVTAPNTSYRTLAIRVALLCIASGSLDAVTVLAVGDAFASVMTGNIVLLGVAAGAGDVARIVLCLAALTGYVLGGVGGSWWTEFRQRADDDAVWPRCVTSTLWWELLLLAVLAVSWAMLSRQTADDLALLILALAAMAMGLQGAAVRAIGVTVSTTYMTGALTGIAEAIARRTPFAVTHRSGVYGLVALLAGASAGGLLVYVARSTALVVPAVAIAAVIAISVIEHRRGVA